MNPQKLCILFLALMVSTYLIEARSDLFGVDSYSETYYTQPFSKTLPFRDTIESQWQGILPPGLAIYGWNVTALDASFINISKADIVTSKNVHYNKTHNAMYRAPGGQPTTLHGYHFEVADPCMLTLEKDETFRVFYHAETSGNGGRWGQYLRVETVPVLVLPPFGIGQLAFPVCRKAYTPDLVCEMISPRYIKLAIAAFQPGETEDFDIVIESPLTGINQTLTALVITSGTDCPTSDSAPTRHIIDVTTIGTTFYEFTVMAHAENVWIKLVPANKLHGDILTADFYSVSVRSRRVTPSGDPLVPVSDTPSGGAIFGIIVAVLAGVGIIGFALYYFRAKWMPGQNNYSNL